MGHSNWKSKKLLRKLGSKRKPFYPNNSGHWPTSEEGLSSSHPLEEGPTTYVNSLRPKYQEEVTNARLIRDGVYID